ncbi:hypothetical protein CVT24_004305 [Panaeolus cyanescens]|uniref:ATP-dependent DNA helicase n=1 Tax=Panaeolus cyanescens TaxID=181874 RepID=A0A409VDC4_9AGAR|nr:hypothetical protein CVT24_004305 [Panaeolus cyanescens]
MSAIASQNGRPVADENINLSEEQIKVLRIVRSGQNTFFTGPAGTGKSVLLREIIKDLRERMRPSEFAVTASTGMAGLNVGGKTLHSFAAVGLGKDDVENLVDRMKEFSKTKWRRTKVLVIDESQFPVKSEVEKCNKKKLSTLAGPQHTYMSMDSVGYDVFGEPIESENAHSLLDRLIAVPFLSLKVGAQVMLIQNCVLNMGEENEIWMVNGSLAYVAISRVTSTDGLELTNFHPSKIKAHPRVVSWNIAWSSTFGGGDLSDDSDLDDI